MTFDEDDEPFVSVLRADLPTAEQQDTMRKRLFAAGLSVSSGLATMSATSVAQGGAATASTASVLSKLGALSWPAKVGLAAALAAPAVGVPLWIAAPSAPRASVATSAPRAVVPAPPHAVATVVEPTPVTVPSPPPAPAAVPPVVAAARPALERVPIATPAPIAATQPASTSASPSPGAVAAFEPAPSPLPSPAPSDASAAKQRATTLAAETALLDRAFAELSAGHRDAAAALIDEHARRFPNGLLRQERERARSRLSNDFK